MSKKKIYASQVIIPLELKLITCEDLLQYLFTVKPKAIKKRKK
jgi:hypothetical protein